MCVRHATQVNHPAEDRGCDGCAGRRRRRSQRRVGIALAGGPLLRFRARCTAATVFVRLPMPYPTTVFRRILLRALAVLPLLALGLAGTAAAQEFRVFTAVYDLAAAQGSRPPVVARSLTLYHAGNFYDLVDNAGEVIIYEPNARRFRILNPTRNLTATVELDEIKQLLKVARTETERYATELEEATDPAAAGTLALLHCQLDPRFTESFDDATRTLALDAGPLSYQVTTANPERPGIAAAYLNYADEVCRLNYVLHPGPLLPEARLAVNRALRARNALPTVVELQTAGTPGRHLRAEHALHWELDARDRGLIHTWESQLKATSLRTVTLQEYQRTVLTTAAK